MPFGRKSPALEALVLPGVILAYKYSQFRQRRREAASRRVTERELSALHHKIDKLLSKLDESEPEPPTSQEDECVICINAKATMQTSPCRHRVVCRKCFVKTIQSAVAQRLLPLRCVICRTRVSRLTTDSGTFRLQGSSSTYSVGSKSWSVPGSASSYSVNSRVAASASLYSMSSGSSCLSSSSNNTNLSGASSKSEMSSVSSSLSSATNNSTSSDKMNHHSHRSHEHCPVGCLGAVQKPIRNPLQPQNSYRQISSSSKYRYPDMPNRLTPIKEYKSPSRIIPVKIPTPSPVLMNPKFRFASYTQPTKLSSPHESIPLLLTSSKGEQSINSKISKSNTSVTKLGLSNAKISPMINIKSPINKNSMVSSSNKYVISPVAVTPRVVSATTASNCVKQEDKTDNNNYESVEKRKKEEKSKLKADKDARKEEKRIAKEEERLAKMLAKEEKKRGKKEAREALLTSDNGRK